jgi:hypothetical protein
MKETIGKSDVAAAIRKLRAAFPSYHPDPQATTEVFLQGLEDLDPDMFHAAIVACITEPGRAFAPSVGEIRQAAMRIFSQVEEVPSALAAYNEAVEAPAPEERIIWLADLPDDDPRKIEALKEHSRYIRVWVHHSWSHRLVKKVAEMLGWPEDFPTDEPGVDRAQWERAYKAEVERYLRRRFQPPILSKFIEARRQPKRLVDGQVAPPTYDLPSDDAFEPLRRYLARKDQEEANKKDPPSES